MRLIKTRGLALSYIKYGESSIIAKIFTEEHGLRSFILNSARNGGKTGGKMAFFSPMTCLDLVAYFDEKKDISRIKEIKCFAPYTSIPYRAEKTALALFMAEITLKVTRGEQQERELFEFMVAGLHLLDTDRVSLSSFAVTFLAGMAGYLGFGTDSAEEIFEQTGTVTTDKPPIIAYLQNKINFGFSDQSHLPSALQRSCLDVMLNFYALHIHHFHPLKSTQIFREIF